MEIIYLVLGLAVGILIGWLFAKLLKKDTPAGSDAIQSAALLAATTEAATVLGMPVGVGIEAVAATTTVLALGRRFMGPPESGVAGP